MVIKLGSLFDGIGGFPLAGVKFGFVPVWASEIEPWPIKVTERRFPDMERLGDITQINGAEIEPVDIITFGSPCFPAGTLILTETGYSPIESVQIGDKVFTHKGNWKRVIDAGWKYSNTIILSGSHYGLELTPNHPIWSAGTKKYYPTYNNGKRGNKRKLINIGEWTRADNMKEKRWAIPNSVTGIKIPSITSCSNKANDAPQLNEDTFYFIGRWLGDGWLRDGQRPNRPDGQTWGQIFLCCSHDEADNVEKMVKSVFPVAMMLNERTATKFRISNISFAKWLKGNFSEHASEKTLPAWAYCMEDKYKQALLNGYMDSDGWEVRSGSKRATTISVKLAHGIRLLAETLGYSTAVYKCEMPPSTTIEGRVVSQKTMYQIDINSNKRTQAITTDTHSWYPVKKISPGREKVKVFNITVDDDCSYIAEGFVVHNCQDLSVAGKREGLAGARSGLFMDAVRIIREMRTATDGQYPRFAVWENVPGAFSSNKRQDFRAVLEEVTETEIPMPASGKWATAGMVRTERVDVAWRVLDAQHWGVPQRRKRIFLVADFGGQCAGEILFVEEGLRGDIAESREAREEAAGDVGTGVEESVYGLDLSKKIEGIGIQRQVAPTLTIGTHAGHCTHVLGELSRINCTPDGITGAVSSKWAKGTGGPAGDEHYNLVAVPQLYDMTHADEVRDLGDKSGALAAQPGMKQQTFIYGICSDSSNSMKSSNPHSGIYKADTTRTLDLNGGNPACNQGGMAIVQHYAVRRLTPLECLRLQGFPDYWLDIEGMSDTQKYKAIGNSVAIPCVKFVLGGIARAIRPEG